jgi:NTP pyrophosphatase (non-canonical NTP hydrolase)
MTIKEYQERTDSWIKDLGVRYFNELTNLAILMEEVGEFSRLMARVYGEQSFKSNEQSEGIKEKIADEAADILFVLTCLCNQMDINLEQAIQNNFEKKTIRDKSRHHDNPKLQ